MQLIQNRNGIDQSGPQKKAAGTGLTGFPLPGKDSLVAH